MKKNVILIFFIAHTFLATNANSEHYFTACKNGNIPQALRALKNDRTKKLTTLTNEDGLTGLMIAASNRQRELIKKILFFYSQHAIQMQDEQRNLTARGWAEYHDWEACALLLPEEHYFRN